MRTSRRRIPMTSSSQSLVKNTPRCIRIYDSAACFFFFFKAIPFQQLDHFNESTVLEKTTLRSETCNVDKGRGEKRRAAARLSSRKYEVPPLILPSRRFTAMGSSRGQHVLPWAFLEGPRRARNPRTGAVEPGNGRFRAAATPGVALVPEHAWLQPP